MSTTSEFRPQVIPARRPIRALAIGAFLLGMIGAGATTCREGCLASTAVTRRVMTEADSRAVALCVTYMYSKLLNDPGSIGPQDMSQIEDSFLVSCLKAVETP